VMTKTSKWTLEMDDAVREAYATRTRLAEVAERLGVTRLAVIGRARVLGLCQPVDKVLLELAQIPWRIQQIRESARKRASYPRPGRRKRIDA
jgi:hypothetical protein